MNIKVAYIIPVYNVNKYLEEALVSVSLIKSPKEVWVIDDCGSENPWPIFEKFNAADFKFIRNEKNIGQGASRNVAMKNISSDITHVFFLDPDDKVDPEKLDRAVFNEVKLGQSFLRKGYFDWTSKKITTSVPGASFQVKIADKIIDAPSQVWGCFWDAAACKKNSFNGRIFEDTPWVIDLIETNSQIVQLKDLFYFYRLRFSASTKSKMNYESVNAFARLVDAVHCAEIHNKKKYLSMQFQSFFESYLFLKAKERTFVTFPVYNPQLKKMIIRIAVFFQKISGFNYWYTKKIERKNYFK